MGLSARSLSVRSVVEAATAHGNARFLHNHRSLESNVLINYTLRHDHVWSGALSQHIIQSTSWISNEVHIRFPIHNVNLKRMLDVFPRLSDSRLDRLGGGQLVSQENGTSNYEVWIPADGSSMISHNSMIWLRLMDLSVISLQVLNESTPDEIDILTIYL